MIPDEFKRFTRAFYQGSLEQSSSIDTWIDGALAHLSFEQKQFIDGLLAEDRDEADLQAIWNNSDSDYYISGMSGARNLLIAIQRRMRS